MGQPLFDRSPELTAERHLEGARCNIAYADSLRDAHVSDAEVDPMVVGWAITALFYAAVHAVRAYLRHAKGVVVSSHEDIRKFEEKYPELRRTEVPYKHLKQQSESARYYLNSRFTWTDYEELRKDAVRVLKVWESKIGAPPT